MSLIWWIICGRYVSRWSMRGWRWWSIMCSTSYSTVIWAFSNLQLIDEYEIVQYSWLRAKTCIIYHIDHVMQLATVRIEPLNQFSWMEDFPWIWINGRHKFLTIGPLYNIMVITTAKETSVPKLSLTLEDFEDQEPPTWVQLQWQRLGKLWCSPLMQWRSERCILSLQSTCLKSNPPQEEKEQKVPRKEQLWALVSVFFQEHRQKGTSLGRTQYVDKLCRHEGSSHDWKKLLWENIEM